MVRPLDVAQLGKLHMTGETVTVRFEDRADTQQQRSEYLTKHTFFITTSAKAPPFAEFILSMELPDGRFLGKLRVRLIQIMHLGNQPGLLLQVLQIPADLFPKIDAYLATHDEAKDSFLTSEPLAPDPVFEAATFDQPTFDGMFDDEDGPNPLLDDADLLASVASESLDSLGLTFGSHGQSAYEPDDEDEEDEGPDLGSLHSMGLNFEDEPLFDDKHEMSKDHLAPSTSSPRPRESQAPVTAEPPAEPEEPEPGADEGSDAEAEQAAGNAGSDDPRETQGWASLSGLNRAELIEKLRAMNPNERARLAKHANRPIRSILIRDNEATVIQFLLGNPHLTRGEIVDISKLPTLTHQSVSAILANKIWSSDEEIRYNLVRNPKTPLPLALKLVPLLNQAHVRELAKDWGAKSQIKQMALNLVVQRGEA